MSEDSQSVGLRSYVVAGDKGVAPNPFYGFCTLALCKWEIRKGARVGDWIVGTGSASKGVGLGGHLVYAMKVMEILGFDDYFHDPRFQVKKPDDKGDRQQKCGDNIYWLENGVWKQLPGSNHGPGDMEHDTKSDRVLISTDYVYFGCKAPKIPEDMASAEKSIVHRNQGKRNFNSDKPSDAEMIANFEEWIRSFGKTGIVGDPINWRDKG